MSATTRPLFPAATVALLAWGALAFGSEYSWAYAPLLVFSVVVGLLGWLASAGRPVPARPLALALAAILAGGLLQLVPLPPRTVGSVSPASVAADYRQLRAQVAMQPVDPTPPPAADARRPISIAPSRTVLGLAFLAAFAILLVACARGMSVVGARGIVRGILVLGLLVALLELVQKASGSDVVFGFWYPPQLKGYQSAPFVNRNHTAGWLIMALSVSAGWFAGSLARGLRGVRPGWRSRLLWLSTRDASETVLAGFSIAVMAVAVVLTASRSGSVCLAVAILVFGLWLTRKQPSRSRRLIGAAYLVTVLLAAALLGGVEVVAQRFYNAAWPSLDGRVNVWKDTVHIIQDAPWSGTGFNTYGIAMLHYQTVQDGSQYIEAHNDYLQLAAEGGVLLGVPMLVALGLFVREAWRRFHEGADDARTYWLRAGAVTGLGAIAVQELFDFTLQMPGAAALFVVLGAIAIHRPLHAHAAAATPPIGRIRTI